MLKAQESFGALDNVTAICKASCIDDGAGAALGRGLGANPLELAEHWIKAAKEHGALDQESSGHGYDQQQVIFVFLPA